MSSSKILSDNGVSSGTSGIIAGGGNDGTLLLQTTTAGGAATTAITIDTSQNVTFAKPFSKIISITASVASNALTVTLNPCALDFRSSTLGSGTVNTRTVSSAISMTVSSGSTLGTVNATASRIVVLAIDNAGTVELAVVNIAGGNKLDETNLISTTAEGGAGAADSNNVIYSTTARSSVPYKVVGFVDSTQTTAGTWATAPSTIQGVGGQALAAMSSLGYGQTWQDVTGSRALSTTYYNTTGKPIVAGINTDSSTALRYCTITVNGILAANSANAPNSPTASDCACSAVVPPGSSYVYGGSTSPSAFFELR